MQRARCSGRVAGGQSPRRAVALARPGFEAAIDKAGGEPVAIRAEREGSGPPSAGGAKTTHDLPVRHVAQFKLRLRRRGQVSLKIRRKCERGGLVREEAG